MSDVVHEPPFFQGVMPFTWRPNRVYRVYVLPGELVFIYAGSAGELFAAGAAHFGAIGGLMAAATNPAKANQQRRERLDSARLDELIADHKHSFRAAAEELSDVILDPRSFWLAAFYHQAFHSGVLRFRHRTRGALRLCLGTVEDMKTALAAVPVALGDVTVNVEWDEYKKKFVRKQF